MVNLKFSITIHFLHSEPDSNRYRQFWRLSCYRYHIRVFFADSSGLESEQQESKSCVLTNYTMNHFFVDQNRIERFPFAFQTNVQTFYTTDPWYLSPDLNWDFTGFKAVFSANWNREASVREKGFEPPIS